MEQFFTDWGPASSAFWVRALWAIAFIVIVFRLAGFGERGTRRAMARTRAHPNAILFLGRVIGYGIIILGFIFALGILGVELSALAAVIGLGTVAITLFFQEIAQNLVAGFYLLIERRFQVGDRIKVEGEEGIIEDIELRATIVRNAADERVIVPNNVMFTKIVIQRKKS